MNVAVCADDRGGTFFMGHRLSSDREIMRDLVMSADGRILIAEYSQPLFEEIECNYEVCGDPLALASDTDICFIEGGICEEYIRDIRALTVYRWNRHYPSDPGSRIYPEKLGFTLCTSEDFPGYSHERITKEIWKHES